MSKIIVRNAELNGMEMDLHGGVGHDDDEQQLRWALDCGPAAVFFHLKDGRRICADTKLGRRIADALYLDS